jgi:hypothetical protein
MVAPRRRKIVIRPRSSHLVQEAFRIEPYTLSASGLGFDPEVIEMKRTTILLFSLLGSLVMAAPSYADDHYRGHQDSREHQDYRAQQDHRGRQDYRRHQDNRRDRDYRRHQDYRGQHGYRPRPYYEHRHYDRYRHGDRDYAYRGHWRSWNSWETYRREHRERFRHGHYYRQDGHLMFRFCDPQGGSCFFFSIGR